VISYYIPLCNECSFLVISSDKIKTYICHKKEIYYIFKIFELCFSLCFETESVRYDDWLVNYKEESEEIPCDFECGIRKERKQSMTLIFDNGNVLKCQIFQSVCIIYNWLFWNVFFYYIFSRDLFIQFFKRVRQVLELIIIIIFNHFIWLFIN
jgi:hypothetical protein